jgi:hypothetical protein
MVGGGQRIGLNQKKRRKQCSFATSSWTPTASSTSPPKILLKAVWSGDRSALELGISLGDNLGLITVVLSEDLAPVWVYFFMLPLEKDLSQTASGSPPREPLRKTPRLCTSPVKWPAWSICKAGPKIGRNNSLRSLTCP